MGEQKRITRSSKRNSTILLDSTDSDIINSSAVPADELDLKFNCIKTPLRSILKLSCNSKRNVLNECDENSPDADQENIIKRPINNRCSSYRNHLRQSVMKSPGLENASPSRRKEVEAMNTSIQEAFPIVSLLSKSKLENIQTWLTDNNVSQVMTPPFANLSVPSLVARRKSVLLSTAKKKKCDLDKSVDSDVEKVLVTVYGDDWREKKILKKSKTEPKRKPNPVTNGKTLTPATVTKVRPKARRNIFIPEQFQTPGQNIDTKPIWSAQRCVADNVLSAEKDRALLNTPTVTTKKGVKGSQSCSKTPKRTFLASLSVSTPNSYCHPEAQNFKLNYKNKKEDLCQQLFKLFNGEVFGGQLPEDMSFTWNVKMRGSAGFCRNKRITKSTGHVIRQSRIQFSTKIVDRADRLRDTLIHELCHAAAWVLDGKLDAHGAVWQGWAAKANARFPELPPIRRCHNYEIVSKYTYRCTGCGYSVNRHSKSIDLERKRCGYCFGVLELLINKIKRGKTEVPEFNSTRTQRAPNVFAIFVKDHYDIIKSRMPGAKHGQVMKALGQEYAAFKQKSAKLDK